MLLIFRLSLLLLIEGFILSLSFSDSEQGIEYFQASTLAYDEDSMQTQEVAFEDTASGETLYQVNDQDNSPLFYYSKIRTGVCFDNECRPLDIAVYWNITGRYLGFVLPKEEFLSKYDHEPFKPDEYKRLNMLLADSLLPLGNVSFEELLQTSSTENKEDTEVDGVSGATSQDVLDYVVEGAAYTTYKLWKIIYGPSQDLVKKLTLNKLSNELLIAILKSPDVGDKFWALNHLLSINQRDSALQNEVLEFVSDENYSLGVAALNTIDSTALRSEEMQICLLEKFYQSNTSIKNLILDKLKEVPTLSNQFVSISSKRISEINGRLLKSFLDIYQIHEIKDKEAIRNIAALLEEDNWYISQNAFKFLKVMEIKDSLVQQKLTNYASVHENQ